MRLWRCSWRSRLEPSVLRRTKDVARELPNAPSRSSAVRFFTVAAPAVSRHRRSGAARRDRAHRRGRRDRRRSVRASRAHASAPGLRASRPDPARSTSTNPKPAAVRGIPRDRRGSARRRCLSSAFASMPKIMRTALQKREVELGYLDGSTATARPKSSVSSLGGPPVFLCSLKAGGVGLTLTAADYVILYDPWWNPAVERQHRSHPSHRTTRPVTAYRAWSPPVRSRRRSGPWPNARVRARAGDQSRQRDRQIAHQRRPRVPSPIPPRGQMNAAAIAEILKREGVDKVSSSPTRATR